MKIGGTGGRRIRIVAALACAAVASCDSQGPSVVLLGELARNRARWAEVRTPEYSYAVERLCFCGFAAMPVRVTVAEGVVTDRTFVGSGEPVPEELGELFPSVDGLFDVLLDAIERDAYELEVTYDADTGVPLDIAIDYEFNVRDEELGFRVTEVPSS